MMGVGMGMMRGIEWWNMGEEKYCVIAVMMMEMNMMMLGEACSV
jgi:hypothetical protein